MDSRSPSPTALPCTLCRRPAKFRVCTWALWWAFQVPVTLCLLHLVPVQHGCKCGPCCSYTPTCNCVPIQSYGRRLLDQLLPCSRSVTPISTAAAHSTPTTVHTLSRRSFKVMFFSVKLHPAKSKCMELTSTMRAYKTLRTCSSKSGM